ncbi:unnamed protein product [Blepharisma stoltei]|uniref:Uncharacterized protein n=1 Tax=Blepharisma stoltei TaxID=1481888 RepID=A0AAU9J346_9CILI|nr:unnamed protein product [Blepharisma stoltei]
MADVSKSLSEKENPIFLESQIDRINAALEEALNEIENRSPIRVENSDIMKSIGSILTAEEVEYDSLRLEEQLQVYDSFYIQDDFEQKLEDLLIQLDRYQMIIEDFSAFEMRISENPKHLRVSCTNIDVFNNIRIFNRILDNKSDQSVEIPFGDVVLNLDIQYEVLSYQDIAKERSEEYRTKEYLEGYIRELENEIDELKDAQILCENFHGGMNKNSLEKSKKSYEKSWRENSISIDRIREEITSEIEMKYALNKDPQSELAQEYLNSQQEELGELKAHYLMRIRELNEQKSMLVKRENELKSAKSSYEREKQIWRDQMRIQEQETYKLKRHLEMFFKNYGYQDLSVSSQQLLSKEVDFDFSIDDSFVSSSTKTRTPSYRFKQVIGLQGRLEELESKIKEYSETTGDPDKIELKIDNVKNKISNLRGEKAIYESKKQVRSLAHMVRAMEKESDNKEKKRKDLIQQIYKKYGIASKIMMSQYSRTRKLETPRAQAFLFPIQENSPERCSTTESPEQLSTNYSDILMPQDPNLLSLDKNSDYLDQKENQFTDDDRYFQELLNKIPDSKDYFEILKDEKIELEREKERISSEREHIKQIKEKLEEGNEKLNKIKSEQMKERKLIAKEKKELNRLHKIVYSILQNLQMVPLHTV